MTALIVVIICLSLMGSALWIMPPKKERQRMALRMQARKLGLTVQLTSIDLPDKWDKSLNRKKTVSYSYYRHKPVLSLPDCIWLLPYEVWKYHKLEAGWWSSELLSIDEQVNCFLKDYGNAITAIKITPEYVSVYWWEEGDAAMLELLARNIMLLEGLHSVSSK